MISTAEGPVQGLRLSDRLPKPQATSPDTAALVIHQLNISQLIPTVPVNRKAPSRRNHRKTIHRVHISLLVFARFGFSL